MAKVKVILDGGFWFWLKEGETASKVMGRVMSARRSSHPTLPFATGDGDTVVVDAQAVVAAYEDIDGVDDIHHGAP